jgi:hypothetical protein
MLDCLEFVLRKYFNINLIKNTLSIQDIIVIEEEIEKYKDIKAVDTVGDFVGEVGAM